MFEIRESYREMIDVKMIKSIDQEEITQLRRQEYTPSKLYYDVDTVFQELYPNYCKLLLWKKGWEINWVKQLWRL